MTRTHRLQKAPPTDPDEIRERLRWVKWHKVWGHPMTLRIPPNDEDLFDDQGHLRRPEPHWEEKTHHTSDFDDLVSIDFVWVDPNTETIEDDDSRNTAFRVWLEAGPWHDQSQDKEFWPPEEGWNDRNKWVASHDHRLDCGGPTLVSALLELASLVELFYDEDGNERPDAPETCDGDFEEGTENYLPDCIWGADGFCVTCGFSPEHILGSETQMQVLGKRLREALNEDDEFFSVDPPKNGA